MAPAARISLPSFTQPLGLSASRGFRVQGWDPLMILSQIFALQSLHYLSLSLLLPPFLTLFCSPPLLAYEGGPSSISMILDWRAFTGLSTVSLAARRGQIGGLVGIGGGGPDGLAGVRGLGEVLTVGDISRGLVRVVEGDMMRGWVVAGGWIVTSLTDVFYLYHLIRRPTHILDFSLTLIFNHLILTTYYSSSFPTSFFFWFILTISTIAQVVLAEQCCVSREMYEGYNMGMGGGDAYGLTPMIGGMTPIPEGRDRERSRSRERDRERSRDRLGAMGIERKGGYERVGGDDR